MKPSKALTQSIETREGKYFWRYDPEVFESISSEHFQAATWQSKNAITGQSVGRGTTWFLKLDSGHEAVLKHYRRGGLLAKINEDSYLFTGMKNTRAYREYVLLEEMRKRDLPVPRPLAIQIQRSGLFYKADLITEKIAEAKDLFHILLNKPLPKEKYQQIGKTINQFLDAGIYHADLNIHNILIDKAGKIWLIDFDKGERRHPEHSWQKQNIDRLKRSFAKEKERAGIDTSGYDQLFT